MWGIAWGIKNFKELDIPAKQRFKTKYPGVFYIIGRSSKGNPEKIYYIRYRKNGKPIEEKAGRQYQDDMTPAKASGIRSDRVEGNELSNIEQRLALQRNLYISATIFYSFFWCER